MREYEHRLVEEIKKGLKPFSNRARNAEGLSVCFNVMPYDEGVRGHIPVVSLNDADKDWGETAELPSNTTTRDITISISDFVDGEDVDGALVYLDGSLAGTTDSNGEVSITGVTVGGHTIKVTKAGYIDSDSDAICNDFIMVT